MNRHKVGILCLLSIAVLTAGCGQSAAQVSFSGDMNRTQDGFQMEGQLIDEVGPTVNFENVTVYLYSSEGELIKERKLGTYSGNSEQFVLRSDRAPHYIIIDSPTFWDRGNVGVDYYEWSDVNSRYVGKPVGSRDELPVDVPESSAHSFRVGETDDSETVPLPFGEVYSGSGDDDTPERLPNVGSNRWSIVRAGWSGDAAFYHSVNGQQRLYYPFSIEEMMTVREP